MKLRDQHVGDMMFLVTLEDRFFRLGVGLQGGIQHVLFEELVDLQLVGDGVEERRSRPDGTFARLLSLREEGFEAAMVVLEKRERIVSVARERKTADGFDGASDGTAHG
jgi:hypothetical protein